MRYFLILLFLISFSDLFSQTRYFYTGKDYGSEATYNPLNLVLNASYDTIQLDGSSRRIFELPYRAGARNVFKNLADPFGPISRFGWGKFLSNEVFPFQFSKDGA